MGSSNVELVHRFRHADVREFDSLLNPDVEWVLPKRTLHGIEEVREYYAPTDSAGYDHLDVTEERGELEDLGDGRVAATNRYIFRWKESGEISHESSARLEYTIRDGKIVRYEAVQLASGS